MYPEKFKGNVIMAFKHNQCSLCHCYKEILKCRKDIILEEYFTFELFLLIHICLNSFVLYHLRHSKGDKCEFLTSLLVFFPFTLKKLNCFFQNLRQYRINLDVKIWFQLSKDRPTSRHLLYYFFI